MEHRITPSEGFGQSYLSATLPRELQEEFYPDKRFGDLMMFAVDAFPGLGDIIAAAEMRNALRDSDYARAALLGASLIPGIIELDQPAKLLQKHLIDSAAKKATRSRNIEIGKEGAEWLKRQKPANPNVQGVPDN